MGPWRRYSEGFARYRGNDGARARRWLRRVGRCLHDVGWQAPVPGLALDAGCGTGRFLRPLATAFGGVIGLDREPAQLDRARPRVTAARGQALLVRGDVHALPLPDGSMDLVFASMVMEHVSDRTAVLREFTRVLRPGGFVVLRTMLPWDVRASHWYRCSPTARRLELARTPGAPAWHTLAGDAGLVLALRRSYRERLDPAVAGRSGDRVQAGAYEVLHRLDRCHRLRATRQARRLDRRRRPECTAASLLVMRTAPPLPLPPLVDASTEGEAP